MAKFSWKKIPLHHQILAALVLGALFGALFNVSKYELALTIRSDAKGEAVTIKNWRTVRVIREDTVTVASFGAEDQLPLLQFFKRSQKEERQQWTLVVMDVDGKQQRFTNIQAIEKVKTLAVLIKPIGTLFIRLLMFVAIPMVLASLIVGAASLGDIRRVGRLGGKTILWYLFTIIIAISIGLTLVNVIQPGLKISPDAREKLMTEFRPDLTTSVPPIDLVDMFVRIVPTNPFAAMTGGEMLQIIFFALMVGVCLTLVPAERAAPVISFFEGFSDLMIRMVGMIMTVAPFGVFALISATVGEFGFEVLGTLFWYALTVLLGLAIHTFGVLPAAVRVLAKIPYRKFMGGMRDPMIVGFTTSSSAATLPVNMKACEDNLGVPNNITSFVLPLGATVNMDGTSMYQAVATVFIAQVYGFDLNLGQQLTILLTAVLASVGTAPVPGVGIVMLMIVLKSVSVPEEGIALIIGVDRFLDMCRTVPNILGDAAVATVIARSEGVLERGE